MNLGQGIQISIRANRSRYLGDQMRLLWLTYFT